MKAKLLAILMTVMMVFAMVPLTVGVAFADDENAEVTEVEVTAPDAVDTEAAEPEAVEEDAADVSKGEVAARGVTKYNVWIKGKRVTSKYKSGKGWKYTEKDGVGTLTLKKVKLSGSYEKGVIYAKGIILGVKVVGKNTITNKAQGGSAIRVDSIGDENGYLGIYGSGSLNAKANENTICANYTIDINNTTVKAESVKSFAINSETNHVDVVYSNLNVVSGEGDSIHAYNRISFQDSIAAVRAKTGPAIHSERASVHVYSSKVTVTSGTYGVQTLDGHIYISNSGYKYPAYLEASGDTTAVAASDEIRFDGLKILEPEGGYLNSYDYYSYTVGTDIDGQFQPAKHVIISNYANTLNVKGKTATVKYKKLKKATQTVEPEKAYTITDPGQGDLTFTKSSGNKKITVGEDGTITVKKGLKKGKFKVKVKIHATGDADHNFVDKTVTVTIKVK